MKVAAAFLVLTAMGVFGADWPHYRGPNQDGSTSETIASISKSGLRELWRVELGTGLSSVVAAGGKVYSAGFRNGKEELVCLDTQAGKVQWTQEWRAKLGDYLFEGGPRGTPTLDGDRVYMVGADGDVVCANTANGKIVWRKNLVKDFDGRRMDWGFSGSPTVDG